MLDVPRNVAIFNETRDRIALAFDLDKDDQAVIDTASGETNLEELPAAALREARMAGEMAEGAKRIIDATRARQERLKLKAESLRKAVSWALAEAGLQKITAPDLTASLGHGRPRRRSTKTDCRPRSRTRSCPTSRTTIESRPRSTSAMCPKVSRFQTRKWCLRCGCVMIGRPKNTSDSSGSGSLLGRPMNAGLGDCLQRTDTAGSLRTGSGTTPIA